MIGFDATVQRIGERLILRLPAHASAELPSRGQVAVAAAMNGHAFEVVLEPDGRKGHWLPIDDALRDAVEVEDGDTVTLELESNLPDKVNDFWSQFLPGLVQSVEYPFKNVPVHERGNASRFFGTMNDSAPKAPQG